MSRVGRCGVGENAGGLESLTPDSLLVDRFPSLLLVSDVGHRQ